MKINYFAKIYNEERILPYVFKHYDKFVNKYYIWNHASTDKTLEILLQNPKVTVFNLPAGPFDDEENRVIKNIAWKQYADNCDWVILADCDEFLYHPELLKKLREYKEKGITIPKIEGYQMFTDLGFPYQYDMQIYDIIKNGKRAMNYDKNIIIDPKINPNYSFGAHYMNPEGKVKYSEQSELKLLHYKIFGEEFIQKMMNRNNTLSKKNKSLGLGTYSLDPNAQFNPKKEYENLKKESRKIL